MKHINSLSFGVIALLVLAGNAFAETNIDVSNNGANSHTSVDVENNSSSNVESSNTSSVNTNIRIEQNGQVKEYHSSQPGDVHIQSDNGGASVHVNNTQTQNSIQVQPTEDTDNSISVESNDDVTPTIVVKHEARVPVKKGEAKITHKVGIQALIATLEARLSFLKTLLSFHL